MMTVEEIAKRVDDAEQIAEKDGQLASLDRLARRRLLAERVFVRWRRERAGGTR